MLASRRSVVLLIDDDAGARYAARRDLEVGGYSVIEAVNGAHAIRISEGVIPDVIVADLDMPVMNGWQMIRQLRADGRYANLPIIVATSSVPDGFEPQLDVLCTLRKPVPREVLLDKLREALAPAGLERPVPP